METPCPSSPRIAYLTSEYPAVSHTFILREVAALRRLGLHVETCAIRRTDPAVHHRGPAERRAAAETFHVLAAARNPAVLVGAQLVALRRPGRWLRALRRALALSGPGAKALLFQMIYFAEAAVLARHLRRRGIDHLHNHFANASCTVALLAAELSGIPFSFTLHGPADFLEAGRRGLGEKIARARFVACISQFCRSQGMMFSAPEHWDKLTIVHCGVDPARYDRGPRTRFGKRVLFVGRLAAAKGLPILLEAVARLRTGHPDARLTLIGDGPERPAIEARAAALGVADIVTFAGYRSQDEVAEALAETDIFALPSFAEGVPVVLMEAMASRLPVVATRIAGIPELVENGVSGLLVPPGDPGALAQALDRIMADPELARAMGDAGRLQVAEAYSSNIEATRLGRLFQAGHPAPAGPSGVPAAGCRT